MYSCAGTCVSVKPPVLCKWTSFGTEQMYIWEKRPHMEVYIYWCVWLPQWLSVSPWEVCINGGMTLHVHVLCISTGNLTGQSFDAFKNSYQSL